jgi:hypothetical protein
LRVDLAEGVEPGSSARTGTIKCHREYSMKGLSVFYESAAGKGTVTCDNGQTVPVFSRTEGGGLTEGKVNMVDKGTGIARPLRKGPRHGPRVVLGELVTERVQSKETK